MTILNLLLLIHIVGVITWIGAAITIDTLRVKATRSKDKTKIKEVINDNAWLGTRIFMPAGIITLITGIAQVIINKGIKITDLWIIVGLTGILVAIVHGSVVIGGLESKLDKLQVKDKDFIKTYDSFVAATRMSLALLFVILLDMVIKPTTDDTGFFIFAGAFLLIAAFYLHRETETD